MWTLLTMQYVRLRWRFAVAGILIGSAFLHAWVWWIGLIGLALLHGALLRTSTLTLRIIGAAGTGIIKGLFATAWLLDSFPADWIASVERTEQLIFIAFCWIGSGVSTGLGYALLGFVSSRSGSIMRALSFSVALVLGEILGALLFSLYTLGSTSGLNANFSFGMSGFLLADHRLLLGFASIGGVYILSFICGLIAIAIATTYAHNGWRYACGAVGIVLCTSTLPGLHTLRDTAEIRVAAIDTEYSSYRTMSDVVMHERRNELARAVESALDLGATVVALPEDTRLGVGIAPEKAAESLALFAHKPNAYVVDSYRTEQPDGTSLIRGYIYDLDRGRAYIEDKVFMVPVGEYLPWLHDTLAQLMNGASVFEHMTYVAGDAALNQDDPEQVPSILFCFESGATPVVRAKKNARDIPLIVHPVSHAWFHDPHTLWNQERQMLMVQSAYSGAPILQAGNKAPSVLYLPDGGTRHGVEVASGDAWRTLVFVTH